MPKGGAVFRIMGTSIFLLQILLTGSPAGSNDVAGECEKLPYVIRIHADWCGSCRATDSVWERIRLELNDQAILVKLDVTDRPAYNESLSEVQRLGLEEFFQEHRSRTGTVAVLHCRTHEPVRILNAERDFKKYLEAVQEAGLTS